MNNDNIISNDIMEKQHNLNIINNYCDNKEKKDVIENNENEKNVFLDEEKKNV